MKSGLAVLKLNFLFPLLVLAAAARPASAGTWNRFSPEAISFEGTIEAGEYERFSKVYDPSKTKVIYVNSSGGIMEEGLKIGLVLATRPIKIVVNGWCLSSCANYLFVGGSTREIHGIVGFHGNATGCFTGKGQAVVDKNLRDAILSASPDASEDDIADEIRKVHAQTEGLVRDEAALNRKMGVSQVLFDRSCLLDKGMGDGQEYELWLPTAQTFELYGFHGVLGEQDRDLASGFMYNVLVK